jgi:Uma2 family endonuclease
MGVVTLLPHGRPLTGADLDRMPDDGHRYELVDGVLIVSPSPRRVHQRAVFRLARLLDDACAAEFEALPGPLDVALADDTVMIPDIVVGRRADFTDKNLPVAPVLAVEVLSPNTRRFDLLLKRSRFESAGAQAYWVVDPDEPFLTAWELRDGSYVEVAHAKADEAYQATTPFPVTVVPRNLVAERPFP